jgi:hypothetical protein
MASCRGTNFDKLKQRIKTPETQEEIIWRDSHKGENGSIRLIVEGKCFYVSKMVNKREGNRKLGLDM